MNRNDEVFKVKGDGTIERVQVDSQYDGPVGLKKELLNIFEVNSYSKKLLAAYKARKYANKIAKSSYGKENYKEYVEMLMIKHYPKEFEKSRLGTKYVFWLWTTIIIAVIPYFFLIPAIILLFTIVIPTFKKMKAIN